MHRPASDPDAATAADSPHLVDADFDAAPFGATSTAAPCEPSDAFRGTQPVQATWHDGRLWIWGTDEHESSLTIGLPGEAGREVPATPLAGRALLESLEPLPADAGDSVQCLATLLAFARSAVAREQFYPSARRQRDCVIGSWRLLVGDPRDVERLEAFSAAMPGVCFCADEPFQPADRLELVESFLDACCDALVRESLAKDEFFSGVHDRAADPAADAEVRWVSALVADPDHVARDATRGIVRGRDSEVTTLLDKVQTWTARLGDAGGDPWRLGFILEEPADLVDDDVPLVAAPVELDDYGEPMSPPTLMPRVEIWPLRWQLLPPAELADHHVPLPAEQVWEQPAGSIGYTGRNAVRLRERLLAEMKRAADFFPPLQRLMLQWPSRGGPSGMALSSTEAFRLIRDWAESLQEANFSVELPGWANSRDNRLEVVMDLRPTDGVDFDSVTAGRVGLDALLSFDWKIAVGGEPIDAAEFRRLVNEQRPLIRRGGRWIEVDPESAGAAAELIAKRPPGHLTLGEAFRAGFGLGEFKSAGGATPAVRLAGTKWIEELLEQAPDTAAEKVPQPENFKGQLRPYQLRGLQWLAFLDRLGLGGVLADDMGLGKAQPLDAKVLTPSGWTTMGQLSIGQQVVGSNGHPTRVMGIFPQGELDVFQVSFSDGSSVKCCEEHLWNVNTPARRHRGLPGRVLPLKQIRHDLRDAAGNCRHFVPMVEPVEFAPGDALPLDPYLLGVLLGDGGLKHGAMFSSADEEIVAAVAAVLPEGLRVVPVNGSGHDFDIRSASDGEPNELIRTLNQLGLMGCGSPEKFIPDAYKLASPKDRLALLRGLLDTDGHLRPVDNNIEFCTTSPQLAADVQFLAHSFGGTARIRTKVTRRRDAFRMSIALPGDLNPFQLSRNASVYRPRVKYQPCRAIVNVEPVGRKACQCISVEAADQLYVTNDFIVTHNTIQLIALLLHEKNRHTEHLAQHGIPKHPTLLFVPTSVLGNWGRELERFAPVLKVLPHHGPGRLRGEAFRKAAEASDIVVTSYALSHRDKGDFGRVSWGRVALDEAQKIKNPLAASSVAVRGLIAPRRVALTGTPVENHLGELWSIMDLLNPGLLGTQGEFRERFSIPIEKHGDRGRGRRLKEMIRPFVLRRTKDEPEVAADLPAKMEMSVFCGLTTEQAAMYERITADMLGRIDTASGIRRRGLILSVLTKLKQVCDHPALLAEDPKAADTSLSRSGKAQRLVEMLEEVIEERQKALIFTQYRKMGDLLMPMLEQRLGKPVIFLHGGTPQQKRDDMVQDFQNRTTAEGGAPIFLLSLRAGGLGLNLTAASHVFHYDRWWNPAVENQATDRAHRIGQTRRVQVHKFVTLGTVEERIDKMLAEKSALAQNIVGSGDDWLTELSTGELREYLSLSHRTDYSDEDLDASIEADFGDDDDTDTE